MKDKKTIIIITPEKNNFSALALKEYFITKKDVLCIIIAEEEFENFAYVLLSGKIISDNNWMYKSYNSLRGILQTKNIDKVNIKDDTFNNQNRVFRKMYNIFLRYNPDVLILTSSFVLKYSVATRIKLKHKAKIFVMPDTFVIDKRLINNSVDQYFIQNLEMQRELIDNGIEDGKILLANLPLRQSIVQNLPQVEAREQLKLANIPTILLIGGIDNNDKYIKLAEFLITAKLDINIIIYCHNNPRQLGLANKLKSDKVLVRNEGLERSLAYDASDIIITSPKSSIISEALQKHKLVILFNPTSEMERRVMSYLSLDILVSGTSNQAILDIVNKYFADPTQYQDIINMTNEIMYPEPTEVIAKFILKKISPIHLTASQNKE